MWVNWNFSVPPAEVSIKIGTTTSVDLMDVHRIFE